MIIKRPIGIKKFLKNNSENFIQGNMMEEWTRWNPIDNLSGRYYIDFFGMVGKKWDFAIKLSNEDNTQKIQILFNSFVASYKYTNESYCFGVFGELSKKYGTEFYSKWSFFKIQNSEYVKWIIDKSYDQDFMHFCIVGGDEMIDVIVTKEPEVTIMKPKKAMKIKLD